MGVGDSVTGEAVGLGVEVGLGEGPATAIKVTSED